MIELRPIRCSHPTHQARRGQPDHADVVAYGDVITDGMLCGACGRHDEEQRAIAERLAAGGAEGA